MEDVPGQPTVEALDTTFAARGIDADTRFTAFAGFPTGGEGDGAPTAATVCGDWNAAARAAGVPHRALPLEVGSFEHLPDMLRILKVRSAALGPTLTAEARAGWSALAPPAQADGSAVADVVLKGKEGWRSHATARRAVARAVAAACGGSLERQQVTLIGAGPGAEALGRALTKRGANLAVADPDDAAAARVAGALDARGIRWRAIYSTRTDVLVRAEAGANGTGPVPVGEGPKAYNAAGLEPRLTVADAAAVWGETPFTDAARRRACTLVEPTAVRSAVLAGLFEAATGTGWAGASP